MNSKLVIGRILLLAAGVIGTATQASRAESTQPAGSSLDNPNRCTNKNGLFDPARHIDLKHIRPGMRGYGLTVFQGYAIEKFDVEVVSILHNIKPKSDAILIRCLDERFDKAKSVQGVSGSPVFFDNKIAGAMAFGWALSEEPLYGVTPIRQMLEIQQSALDESPSDTPIHTNYVKFNRNVYDNLMRPSLLSKQNLDYLASESGLTTSKLNNTNADESNGLQTMPMTVILGGFEPQVIDTMKQFIPHLAIMQLAAAGSSVASTPADPSSKPVPLTAGSTMTIPLITGDMTGAVLGTVTEVIGNHVWGFGHPWNNDGPASWPLATGEIHTFVNRISISFKLGSAIDIIGAIQSDESAGVYGEIGAEVAMTPLNYHIEWPYAGVTQDLHVKMARDARMDPLLAAAVTLNAIASKSGLPEDHTIHYEMEMFFDSVDPIRFENVSSSMDFNNIFEEVLAPLGLILNNPWQSVQLERMNVKATILDKDTLYNLKSAQMAQSLYQPGQTVDIQLTLEPFRNKTTTLDISLPLPKDLPDGRYTICVGSNEDYQRQLSSAQPYRFQAFNAQDVQRIILERLALARNRVYISMALNNRGLAIENQAFPDLPDGKAMLINDKTRKAVSSSFRPLITNTIDTDFVMSGSEQFQITVKRHWQ